MAMGMEKLTQPVIGKIFQAGDKLIGQSGREYRVEQVLQARKYVQVHLASYLGRKYILKNLPKEVFSDQFDMQRALRESPHLRVCQDTIPERNIFVFDYMKDEYLSMASMDLPLPLTKRILKDVLRGLAELHSRRVIHLDVKPDNIFIDWHQTDQGIVIDHVRLGDLESSDPLPPDCSDMVANAIGNINWQSPEGHSHGCCVNTPTDMFSFGMVCIYAVLKHIALFVDRDSLPEGESAQVHVLERQISYFGDQEGFDGLIEHLGDSPWCTVFQGLLNGFTEGGIPMKPFRSWVTGKSGPINPDYKDINPDFKDLIAGLTSLAPARRLTANEALSHKWFDGV